MRALTARELAAMKLPELPQSERGIQLLAARDGWAGQKRQARGGGVEFDAAMLMKALPEPAVNALLSRLGDPEPAAFPVPANNQPRDPASLAKWQRACADARAAVLARLDTLIPLLGMERAVMKLVQLADMGELGSELQRLVPAANARRGKNGSRTLSRATLYRWHGARQRDGWWGLVPEDNARAEAVPAWGMPLLNLYRVPTKRSLTAVLDDLAEQLPEGVSMPSYGQARALLKRMAPAEREKGRHGPMALLQFKGFKRKSTKDLVPLDVVTADGHSFKAKVAHFIHGQPFTPEFTLVEDVATRLILGWSAGQAESASGIMSAIRHAVSRWGYFHFFYTDNGSGFKAEMMTSTALGLLGRIGATHINSIPGRAQSRGKIERTNRTWKQSAKKLATYTGGDMDREAAKKIDKLIEADLRADGGSRLLISWPDFMRFLAGEVEAYNNRPHRSLPKVRDDVSGKMRHMSPAELMQDFLDKGWQPRLVEDDVMRDLFRPHVERSCYRGEVKLPWGRYYDRRLEQFHGHKVMVAYDEHDDAKVWVRTLPDERLICIAGKDANVIAEVSLTALEHARHKSAARRIKNKERQIELIQAELGAGVIEHQSRDLTPEEELHQAELIAEFERNGTVLLGAPANANIDDGEPDDRKRFRRGLEVKRQLEAGAIVAAKDAEWFRVYADSSEWRALWGMYEDFGDDMIA